MKAGDSILLIDGTPTQGLSLYEASDLLLGGIGSQVTISVKHNGPLSSTKELNLTRYHHRGTLVKFPRVPLLMFLGLLPLHLGPMPEHSSLQFLATCISLSPLLLSSPIRVFNFCW